MDYGKRKEALRKEQGTKVGEKRVARVYKRKGSRVKSALSFQTKAQKRGKLT